MTEFNDYLKLFKKYSYLIVFLVMAGLLGAYYYTLSQPVRYQSSLTFYLKHSPVALQTSFYTYDGYYAVLAAKEYTETVVGIFKTAEIKKEMEVSAKKLASQLVNFSVISTNPNLSETYVKNLAQVVQEKINSLNKNTSFQNLTLELVSSSPQTEILRPRLLVNLAVGFLSGLVLSLLSASFLEFFRRKK